ncbi:MAG: hypothetical protein IPN76_28440 [Saprospiraceae bacterium]|nr:hypothetical protein [Saprospiraceae bacterium]
MNLWNILQSFLQKTFINFSFSACSGRWLNKIREAMVIKITGNTGGGAFFEVGRKGNILRGYYSDCANEI